MLFANTDWYLYNFRRSLAIALREAGYEVLLVSPAGPYGGKLEALGFIWHAAPMDRRSLNPIREASLLAWLCRLMVAERVDLVHGFTIKCAVYGALAARIAGVPASVNAVAGMGYVFTSSALKAKLLRPVVSALMRAALGGVNSRLILQNPDDKELFESSGLVPTEHIRLIPGSGVDCARFRPDAHLRLQSSANSSLRVLLPARLLWDKGVGEFIFAARQLLEEGRAIDFMLAGEPDPGNPAAVPESTLREWVDNGWVQWLGHVDDMPELFRSVDVVVLPSYREGLPKGLIEAAACAKALVTTDAPGCRDVVDHEVNGLLVPTKDSLALAQAIARLHGDPDLRERLGKSAREKALAQFDERIVIDRTLNVYAELIHQGN